MRFRKRGLTAAALVAMLGFASEPALAQIQTLLTQQRCLIIPSACVWAWGFNNDGQLGNGGNASRSVPGLVLRLSGAVAVAGGGHHSLALMSGGTVWAWGSNTYGQLGNGTFSDSAVPVQVVISDVIAIAAGDNHSLALKSDGTVWAWGLNMHGQLGNGTFIDSDVPVQATGLSGATAVAGSGLHSLALKFDGTVWQWGFTTISLFTNVPVAEPGLSDAVPISVAAGGQHSLALKSDGTVSAWGENGVGQLGNGTNSDSNLPVTGFRGAVAVAAGGQHSLALKPEGTVWAWGFNLSGELGNGTNSDSVQAVQVSGLSAATAVAGGGVHSLARRSDGTVWSWGENSAGQLGNGTNSDSNVPVQVAGLGGAVAVAGGGAHSLAIVGQRPSTFRVSAQISAFQTADCIDNSGMGTALLAKTAQAQGNINAGNTWVAINNLNALLNELQAQSGRHITTFCGDSSFHFNPAALLISEVQAIVAGLKSGGAIAGYAVDSSGAGVSGVTVNLLDASNSAVLTATTDSTGLYLFDKTGVLISGATYTVRPTVSTMPLSQTFTWGGTAIALDNFELTEIVIGMATPPAHAEL